MATETTNRVTLECLPNEILLKIFTYLDSKDVCLAVANVCKRWKYLTRDVTLWKNLNFVCNKDMNIDYLIFVIPKMPLLKSVKLQWRTDVHLICQQLCSNCEDIRHLELVCCGQVKETCIRLLADHFPNLEVFSLGKCWSVEPNCFNLICKFSHLTKLNVSHSRCLAGPVLREIVDSCSFLQHINLDYVRGLSDGDILYLLESKKSSLLSLVLYGECLTDITYCYMEKCSMLCTLHLSSCLLMTDEGLGSIMKVNSLKSFKLRLGINLSTEAINNFLLSDMASKLEYLILSHLDSMNDLAALNISANCINIKYLEVVYCPNVTDQSRECLVAGCKQLKVLHFRQNWPYRCTQC
jgi:F-box/leucine-rich repeat protein 7